jgi:hypothetical protein
MAAGTATRLAGKALADFFKVVGPVASSAVEQKVLGKLLGAGAREAADAPGLMGVVARNPETIARVAGALTPVAAGGIAAGGAALANQLLQSPASVYAQSGYSLPVQRSGTPVAYANQRYTPGMSPMTNQAIAESILEQQKFEHQLQLIQARQAAQQGAGSLSSSGGSGLDIMRLSNQVFSPVSY